jgi:hypothetical protein
MSRRHDRFRELCTAWVLGALEQEEVQEFRQLWKDADTKMRTIHDELEHAVLHLPAGVPPAEPAPHVKARLMEAIRFSRKDREGWISRLAFSLGLGRPRFALWVVLALLVLAVAIGIRINWNQQPDAERGLDMAAFLAALETEPRQEDSREFALLPAGFRKIDPVDAARAAGLTVSGDDTPTPDSQLFGGRVLEVAGQQVYELIYGNADGPYILFVAPDAIEPDFGERRLAHFQAVSPTCASVSSDALSIFWDAGAQLQWILVGRDHSDAFYAEVMQFVAAAFRTEAETAFGWLQSLAGEWEGKFEWTGDLSGGGAIRMDYFLTGLGSAVVENHMTGHQASMSSVYHMDGSRLVMTHFSSLNQPRLEATEIDQEHRKIRFDFVDVTDLAPTEGHMNGVEMLLTDDREITLQYHYIHDGKRSVKHIELSRVVSPAIGE